MLLHQCNEVSGRVAGQGRLAEVGIARKEILWRAVQVGEIAAAATRDQDLAADAIGAFEDDDASASLPRLDGA